MNQIHINKDLIQKRFAKRLYSYNKYAVIQQEICAELAVLIKQYTSSHSIQEALEFGAGTGLLTSRLLPLFPQIRWTINDLVEDVQPFIDCIIQGKNYSVEYQWGDAEILDFQGPFDLIASASALQWFEKPQKFFSKLQQKRGGILAISSFGIDNFHEIRSITGIGLEYTLLDTLISFISDAGYDVLFQETYNKELRFKHPLDVLRHIRQTGVNGIASYNWNKKTVEEFCQKYIQCFGLPSEEVPLTYNPVIIIAQKQ